MTLLDMIGYLAACLVLAAFGMKEMIPLRIVALCSNLAFIAYGLGLGLPPVWLLHASLLPLNGWRLWQALRLSAAMGRPDVSELHVPWRRFRRFVAARRNSYRVCTADGSSPRFKRRRTT